MASKIRRSDRRQYLRHVGATVVSGITVWNAISRTRNDAEVSVSHRDEGPGSPAAHLDNDRTFRARMDSIGGESSIFPSVIAVERGETVGLRLSNTGPRPRQLTIRAYDLETELEPRETTTETFPANGPGVFPIECVASPEFVTGQLFVYPTADSRIPRRSPRRIRVVTTSIADRPSFYPPLNVVIEGEVVTLELTNGSRDTYELTVDALDVEATVGPNETRQISFGADRPGIHPIRETRHETTVSGQLLVLPDDTDFSRLDANGERNYSLVVGSATGREDVLPATVAVKRGERVTLEVDNATESPRELKIDALDVRGRVGANRRTTIGFEATASGIFAVWDDASRREKVAQLLVFP